MKNYTEAKLSEITWMPELFPNKDIEDCRTDPRHVDLSGTNLMYQDLIGEDLRGVNLKGVNLRYADLTGADLDFSCWPLWCGSFNVIVDTRIAAQLAYHFCRLECDDIEYLKARNAIVEFANKFHRVNECGKLLTKEV